MSRGFFILPRAVLESEWYRNATPLATRLWLVLLRKANWTEGTTPKGEKLRAGQLVTSWAALCEETACVERGARVIPTPMKVRWAAMFLREAGEITWCVTGRATGRGILVTLERWAFYAGSIGEATDLATGSATVGSVTPTTTLEEVKDPVAPCGFRKFWQVGSGKSDRLS